jgi:hypothetical protein
MAQSWLGARAGLGSGRVILIAMPMSSRSLEAATQLLRSASSRLSWGFFCSALSLERSHHPSPPFLTDDFAGRLVACAPVLTSAHQSLPL